VSNDPELHTAPSTGRLLKFTGWNLFGLCTPMIVAFFVLPPLRGRMGEDIYGAFMFLLTVINYLSILDLGLGRAVTQFMSTRLASRKNEELPAIFWTSLAMMLGFSGVGMAIFFPLIPPIVGQWSKIPASLQLDAATTLFAAGLGTPFLVLTACLVGVLEAHQKFKLINLIRLPMYKRARIGVAYLPQEPSVFRKLTVEKNILAVLETRSDLDRKSRRRRLEELLSEFGIERIARQPAFTLSGGERRRTEIARALAIEPKYLLLDEPFAGIDPIAVHEIKSIVRKLSASGIGVLITDHNVRDTLEITHEAHIINLGRILVSGNREEVLESELARKIYLGESFRM
jgi:lipopolysaccharide export system ATP-binding protein